VIAALLFAAAAVAAPPRSLLGELEQLDQKLTAAEERLAKLGREDADLRLELAGMEAQIAVARVRRDEAFVQYQKRIVALARMPAGARLVLLGGSRSLADYLEAARVLRWVAQHDKSLHDRYVAEVQRLAALESKLTERRAVLERAAAGVRAQRDDLATAHQGRLALLEQIREQDELRALVAGERSSARRELADMIERLEPAGNLSSRFAQNRGKLPWPAAGKLDVKFGQRVELSYGTVTAHNGIDVRAQTGAPVQAVGAGRVAYAGWLKGYGQLVIVDHGEHYHSLVAHLSRLDVEVGDEVDAGQVIGAVGDTGSLRGTVLYFELRERGVAVDPVPWLRR
jgi:murein hydrolase activator